MDHRGRLRPATVQAYVAGAEVVEAYDPIEASRDPAGLFVVDEDVLTAGGAQLGILRPGFTKPNWEQITIREYDVWDRERDVVDTAGSLWLNRGQSAAVSSGILPLTLDISLFHKPPHIDLSNRPIGRYLNG